MCYLLVNTFQGLHIRRAKRSFFHWTFVLKVKWIIGPPRLKARLNATTLSCDFCPIQWNQVALSVLDSKMNLHWMNTLKSRHNCTGERSLDRCFLPVFALVQFDKTRENVLWIPSWKTAPLWFLHLCTSRTGYFSKDAALQTGRFERTLRPRWQRQIVPVVEHTPTRAAIKNEAKAWETQTPKPPKHPEPSPGPY